MIGFLGKRHSGKDTLSDYLVDNYNYKKRAFAYPLKMCAKALFGFTYKQLYTEEKENKDPYWEISPRNVMQILGADIIRDQFPKYFKLPELKNNFWIKSAERWLQKQNKKFVVWSDVRFQNEADFILNNGGIVIKIIRPTQEDKKDNVDQHQSEKSVDKVKNYSLIIYNNGNIEDLYEKMDKIMEKILFS
jgi:hypothetical protein